MCRESIDFLRETYGIFAYDYLGVNYALEWILSGNFSEKQYLEFKDSIRDMITKVRCPSGVPTPRRGNTCTDSL